MNDQLKRAFDDVVAEDHLKENTRNYLHYRLYGKHRRTVTYGKMAAACCLCMMLGFGGHLIYFTPVSFISIDVNPSIELGINRLDRIISVTPFNIDGMEAVANLELKNRKYDEAILLLLESREMSDYVTEDSQISISVVSDYNEKNDEIQRRVLACTGDQYENVSCHSSNEEVVESAHHEGISFGKYRAFLELQTMYPDITVDDVKNLTMSQIQDLMDLYSDPAAPDSNKKTENSDIDRLEPTVPEETIGETEPLDRGYKNHYSHGHGHSGGRCQY